MTLRTLAREIRDYPATAFLALAWILVFVAMVAVRMREGPSPTWWQFLILGIGDGHRFGDLTLRDLGQGEIWRLVTCNFVHYSLIHIVLNLVGFYLLGTMIESWYGAPQFILVYGLAGGVGNLVSALIRHALNSSPLVHSGGGSVVLMGLIGLCAVVGWRARDSRERGLLGPMLMAVGLTALLGIAFRRYIDNWGHAGGVLVGLPLGLADRGLLRNRYRPSAWGMGVVTGLLIVGCGLAQTIADRREAPARREETLRRELQARDQTFRVLRALSLLVNQKADFRFAVPLVNSVAEILDRGETRAGYRRLRVLAIQGQARPLTEQEWSELKDTIAALMVRLRSELQAELREFWRRKRTQARGQGPES